MSFSYMLKEGFAGFWRSRTNSMISIISVSIALFLLGVFVAITLNFQRIVESLRTRVEVEVFLKDVAETTARESIGPKLQRIPGIQEATFISKEQALQIFKKDAGTDPLDVLEGNPLPASFRVKMRSGYDNSDSIRVLKQQLEKLDGVLYVAYRKQFLQVIENRAYAFQAASFVIGVILAIASVVLVANTIQLAVYAKRELIRTMKLVGATPLFIRLPFLIEGTVHGLLGGIIAAITLVIVMEFFLRPIAADILLTLSVQVLQYFSLILFGAVLGLIGSAIAIRRFLREAIIIAG